MPKIIGDEEYIKDLRRVAEELGKSPSITEYDEHGCYSWGTGAYKFGSWNEAKRKAGLDCYEQMADTTPVSDREFFSDLRRVADGLGHPPRRDEYQEHGKHSYDIAWRRFGGWIKALQEAGFNPDEKPDDRGRNKGECLLSDEELLEDLRAGAEAIGRPPTHQEVRAFGSHSDRTYRQRFGSLAEALEAAGLEVPEHRKQRTPD